MVDRYDPWFDGWDGVVVMDVEHDGDWVSYDDYKAQAARIEQLESALENHENGIANRVYLGGLSGHPNVKRLLATARNDALREAAAWHMEVARHDASGMEYSSLVGIPISNWSELDTSVKTHEFCAREILSLITKEAQ